MPVVWRAALSQSGCQKRQRPMRSHAHAAPCRQRGTGEQRPSTGAPPACLAMGCCRAHGAEGSGGAAAAAAAAVAAAAGSPCRSAGPSSPSTGSAARPPSLPSPSGPRRADCTPSSPRGSSRGSRASHTRSHGPAPGAAPSGATMPRLTLWCSRPPAPQPAAAAAAQGSHGAHIGHASQSVGPQPGAGRWCCRRGRASSRSPR